MPLIPLRQSGLKTKEKKDNDKVTCDIMAKFQQGGVNFLDVGEHSKPPPLSEDIGSVKEFEDLLDRLSYLRLS